MQFHHCVISSVTSTVNFLIRFIPWLIIEPYAIMSSSRVSSAQPLLLHLQNSKTSLIAFPHKLMIMLTTTFDNSHHGTSAGSRIWTQPSRFSRLSVVPIGKAFGLRPANMPVRNFKVICSFSAQHLVIPGRHPWIIMSIVCVGPNSFASQRRRRSARTIV